MQVIQPLNTATHQKTASSGTADLGIAHAVDVLGTHLHPLTWHGAIDVIGRWAHLRESRVVVACNVHSLVTARLQPAFRQALHGADMATADGAPVAWMMRLLGCRGQQRISGPDLMWRYFADAAPRGESIFLYGGDTLTLERLAARIEREFPTLRIAGTWSPPFRELSAEEDQAAVDAINRSGAQTIWVALGCPKQERWMVEHRERLQGVQIGVGAAFAFHAGLVRRAPGWMQRIGLEWFHRLLCEPRRLFSRYLVTNSLFVFWAAAQLLLRR